MEGPLGNLLECIITSGKLILDLYYWLGLRSLSLSQINKLPNLVETTLFQFERLYAYKCWFRNSYSVNDRGIKAHGLIHMVYEIKRSGCLENTNTRIFENKHIVVAKDPFKAGSKRTTTVSSEMFERVERRRLISVLVDRFNELHKDDCVLPEAVTERDLVTNVHDIVYSTKEPNVVMYKCFSFKDSSERVLYDRRRNEIVPEEKEVFRNINPIMNVQHMWYELQQLSSVRRFMKHFMRNDEGSLYH